MTKLYVSAALIVAGTWVIIWLIARLAAREARREMTQRKTLDRIVQASMPPAAPGTNRKRVS